MTKTTQEIVARLGELRYNPVAMQSLGLSLVEEAFGLKDGLVDTSSPLVSMLGISAMNTAAFMHENMRTTRRMYPILARNLEELYPHMSDRDHIGRFAAPVTEKIMRVIPMSAIEASLVMDVTTGVASMIIPAGTKITFGGLTFTQLYAVRIEKFPHNGFMVTYEIPEEHPLFALTSNNITPKIRMNSATLENVMSFEVYVTQVDVRVVNGDMNVATGFNKTYTFNDKFCLARVYNLVGGVWKELPITFSDSTYDRSEPTAVLTVLEDTLNVRIPSIYISSGLITGRLRIEMFTTQGAVHLNAQALDPTAFTEDAEGVLEPVIRQQHRAWQRLAVKHIFAPIIVSGGADELPFETVRERVIDNSIRPQKTPVQANQLATTLSRDGFNLSLHIDTLTKRVIFATKYLPTPRDERLVTAASASIETLVTSFNQALAHPLVNGKDNRITILPEMIYENVNGQIRMLPIQEVNNLLALDKETLAREVTVRDFVFSPFHYVMDADSDLFAARAYYMKRPTAQASIFVDQNASLGMSVITSGYKIRTTETGYRLTIEVTGNDVWRSKENAHIHCQLSYLTPDNLQVFFQGLLVERLDNGDAVFEFDLNTKYDINASHWLTFNNGKYLQDEDRDVYALLDQQFSLLHSYSGPQENGWLDHAIDSQLGTFLLPLRIKAITHEQVDVSFGKHLKHLWVPARAIKSTGSYQKYQEDVPELYASDEYEINEDDGTILFDDGNGGKKLGKLLHRAGETVKSEDGEVKYLHRAGDVIKGSDGEPIPVSEGGIVRHVGLMFLEGAYAFTNNLSAVAYREETVETVVDWITDRLPLIQPETLDQTNIYFAPKTTRGDIVVYNETGLQTTIPASLKFGLRLSVDETVLDNTLLQEEITRSVTVALAKELEKETISRDGFYTTLRGVLGSDVRTFSLTGFWSDRGIEAITPKSPSDRCSIGKALVTLPDGDMIVRENVDVKFEKY